MRTILIFFIMQGSIFSLAQPPKTPFKTIGGKTVFDVPSKNVFIVTSGMTIDADGAPKAYHKNNAVALDFLANAGKPGNWWALATDNKKASGNPLIQKSTDPAPGYYISMTSLQDASKNYSDPTRYVNSEAIPFIAIPRNFSPNFKKGDIALVVNRKNNKRCYAIFVDVGPANKIGEGSIKLAQELGIKSNPKNGGTNAGVTYILMKNSGTGKIMTREQIDSIGKSKLSEEDIIELLK